MAMYIWYLSSVRVDIRIVSTLMPKQVIIIHVFRFPYVTLVYRSMNGAAVNP